MENLKELLAETKRITRQIASEHPEFMKGLGAFHKAAMKDGVLSAKTKELIALAIAVDKLCASCIGHHVQGALHAGATREEMMESVLVACLMGGGPAWIYAKVARKAIDDFGG